ncbi:MAG: hypothetical protein ACR9NN_20250 [Nostochopsis sp.]
MWKRDIQGKFALKDDDYRQVRSLRLTDDTWKAIGIAAECFGMSRSDYLEQVIRGNASPSITRESSQISPDNVWTDGFTYPCMTKELEPMHQAKTTVVELATTPLSVTTLETLRDQILLQLKLGKQAPGYKAVLKALNHFIAALTSFYTQ